MADKTGHIALASSEYLKKKYLGNRYNVRSEVRLSQNFCAFYLELVCGLLSATPIFF